ncbi:MAG: transposase [Patescibacteria group bacterium]
MERKFNFSIDEYYHLYNRGNDKRIIFEDEYDYNRFKLLLYHCNSSMPVDLGKPLSEGRSFSDLMSIDRGTEIVAIGSYVLMPNHFHILVKEITEDGISKFMGKLSTGYSMYFNNKRSRSGSLFEGRFKATHADTNEYLKYLFAYIHLNPVKLIYPLWKDKGLADFAGAKEYLSEYDHSSYLDYCGASRLDRKILNQKYFPAYFSNFKSFDDFINSWLSFSEKDRPPLFSF